MSPPPFRLKAAIFHHGRAKRLIKALQTVEVLLMLLVALASLSFGVSIAARCIRLVTRSTPSNATAPYQLSNHYTGPSALPHYKVADANQ